MSTTTPPRSRFEQLYLALGRKLGEGLFNEVTRAQSLKPRLTASKLVALAFATVVHGLTLALAVLGIALLVLGWPAFFLVALGVLCLGAAWLLHPRVPRFKGQLRSRESLPVLYELTDRIAAALGTPPVDGITVISSFAAAFGQYGLRRKRILYIGQPLLMICAPMERVALLGHELAHGVNGDPNRGLFLGAAINTLLEWHRLFRSGTGVHRASGFVVLAEEFARLVNAVLAQIVWFAIYLLSHLIWRDSQRAEYLADYLAATVAGAEATRSMLEKLYLAPLYSLTVLNVRARPIIIDASGRRHENAGSILEEFQRRAVDVPEPDLQKYWMREMEHAARLDVTHPPTPYRIAFVQSHSSLQAKVSLSQCESEQIDRELGIPLGRRG